MELFKEKIPICCLCCSYLDSDYNEFSERTAHYCNMNVFLPYRKQSCKRQKPKTSKFDFML